MQKPPIAIIVSIMLCASALVMSIWAISFVSLPQQEITGKVQGNVSVEVLAVCGDGFCDPTNEDCTSCSADCGVCPAELEAATPSIGGGGGLAAAAPKASFTIKPDTIQAVLTPGQTTEKPFDIKNDGEVPLHIILKVEGIGKNLVLSDNDIYLEPGQSKTIKAVFYAHEAHSTDVYVGSIVVKAEDIIKKITAILEVQSEEIKFDMEVYLPERFRKVYAGQAIEPQITIFDISKTGEAEVHAYYEIKDSYGNIILSEDEILTVRNQLTFTKTFLLDETLEPGKYVLALKVEHYESIGTASTTFDIIEKVVRFEISAASLIYAAVVIALFVAIFYAIYMRKEIKKIGKKA